MTEPKQLTELDLLTAATPFFRPGTHPMTSERRQALRHAVFDFLRSRGAIPPSAVIDTPEQALDALQALLKRCEEIGVDWTDVVAMVNREYVAPAKPEGVHA